MNRAATSKPIEAGKTRKVRTSQSRFRRAAIVTWLVFTGFVSTFNCAQPPVAAAIPSNFRADRILVKPAAGLPTSRLDGLHAELGTRVVRTFAAIGNLQVVRLPADARVSEVITAYRQSGLVAYAEPDYAVHALATPNDFRYWDGSLWALNNTGQLGGTPDADIDAPEGWDIQNTASNIIVAVIDTGVRLTHEDLASNMWVNPGESGPDPLGLDKSMNGRDDDGDGYIDDVHGINAILETGVPLDDDGHGTHVAGIIGAVGNNGVGVVGVAWRVPIMACKFLNAFVHDLAPGYISDAIECMDYARAKGAKIINASWGGYNFNSTALYDAIDSARAAGIIFVAACGNDANDNDSSPLYPASYHLDNIIAVAATTRNDELASWSNYGATNVHLGAPGLDIFSCWNTTDNAYQFYSGTSMAAAHVSGVCALVWAHFPGDTYRQVINRVLAGTDPLPSLAGKCVTGGRLNLQKALSSATAATAPQMTVERWTQSGTNNPPFQLWLYGAPGQTYRVEGTTNLVDWVFLSTNRTDASGVAEVLDPQWRQFNQRFYHAMLTP